MIIIITTTTIKLNRILIQLLATNYLTKEMYPLCPYLNDLLLLLCMLQLKALFYVVMSGVNIEIFSFEVPSVSFSNRWISTFHLISLNNLAQILNLLFFHLSLFLPYYSLFSLIFFLQLSSIFCFCYFDILILFL